MPSYANSKATADISKFKNSSDPLQRLNAMIYVNKFLSTRRSSKSSGKSLDDAAKNRTAKRVLVSFHKAEKKAFAAFDLKPADETHREMLLGYLAWVLFGPTASRGRP